ncbi:unnamed protein product [Microthlaspi erraticum]|uniref:cellulase n=1 Tax=Microthlaspi erraticum TaxID=1685480 RepID=A0A6D2L399_9BRAS|nr:unnamed protein product [Microthlaspi erraticum]
MKNSIGERHSCAGANLVFSLASSKEADQSRQGPIESIQYDKSTSFWDEILWGGAWMYYATGDVTYLELVTSHELATHAGAFGDSPDYGVK